MKSRVNTQNKKLQVIFNTSLYLNTRRNKWRYLRISPSPETQTIVFQGESLILNHVGRILLLRDKIDYGGDEECSFLYLSRKRRRLRDERMNEPHKPKESKNNFFTLPSSLCFIYFFHFTVTRLWSYKVMTHHHYIHH